MKALLSDKLWAKIQPLLPKPKRRQFRHPSRKPPDRCVDVVTERPADLHRELLLKFGVTDPGPGPVLSGSAYRCIEREGVSVLDVWQEPIALGQTLPTLPLWSRGGLCLPVELEATYERTCIEQRVQPAA